MDGFAASGCGVWSVDADSLAVEVLAESVAVLSVTTLPLPLKWCVDAE